MTRKTDLDEFYRLLDKLGKPVRLRDCHVKMNWPTQGVYFLFEADERRADSDQLRVVRVGIRKRGKSGTTMWDRLKHHYSGSFGSSVLSRHVRDAKKRRGRMLSEKEYDDKEIKSCVRDFNRDMLLLVANVPPKRLKCIECNSISLLSNYNQNAIEDEHGECWLGQWSKDCKVRQSGLWNIDYVDTYDYPYERDFLNHLEKYVLNTGSL